MQQQSINILKSSQLRKTPCRVDVLDMLLAADDHAVAPHSLEEQLNEYDRVTIYRTLNTFVEKGILHKVVDGSGASKYAICSEACDQHAHHDEHIHFSCLKCGITTCINSVKIPLIDLPEGFKTSNINYLVQGVCDKCSA